MLINYTQLVIYLKDNAIYNAGKNKESADEKKVMRNRKKDST